MPRQRNLTPAYIIHKKTGRGRAAWTDGLGQRHEKLLPGKFGSKESLEAFSRLQLELSLRPSRIVSSQEGITVAELLLAYLDFATNHYRTPDGKLASAIVEAKLVMRTIRELYSDLPATEFSPLKLKAVQQFWLNAGLARSEINRRTQLARRIWKWGAGEELIPFETYHRLTAVSGLQKGRTTAPEPEPIEPVDDATVEKTLPHLNRHVRGLVQFQRFTGCRPGEACLVRKCNIDTTGEVWLYRPHHHKNAHRGKPRTIAIGPKCQELLREFFTGNKEAYLFSPRIAMDEITAARSEQRKTPRYPSHMMRNATKRKARPKRTPHERYSTESYGRAIERGCEKAGVPKWCPNQLRHSFATRVRAAHGLEAAQVLLGHSKADTTQIYAERNEALAVAIASKIG